jgi:hypothetical protein
MNDEPGQEFTDIEALAEIPLSELVEPQDLALPTIEAQDLELPQGVELRKIRYGLSRG